MRNIDIIETAAVLWKRGFLTERQIHESILAFQLNANEPTTITTDTIPLTRKSLENTLRCCNMVIGPEFIERWIKGVKPYLEWSRNDKIATII
jgi:hypothetical protein